MQVYLAWRLKNWPRHTKCIVHIRCSRAPFSSPGLSTTHVSYTDAGFAWTRILPLIALTALFGNRTLLYKIWQKHTWNLNYGQMSSRICKTQRLTQKSYCFMQMRIRQGYNINGLITRFTGSLYVSWLFLNQCISLWCLERLRHFNRITFDSSYIGSANMKPVLRVS